MFFYFYFKKAMRYIFGMPSIGEVWGTTCGGYNGKHPAFQNTIKGANDKWSSRIAYFYLIDIQVVNTRSKWGERSTKINYIFHRVSASTNKDAFTVIDESLLKSSWFRAIQH